MDYSYIIRPATTADHEQIAEIWHSSASLPTVGPDAMPTLEELRRRLAMEFEAGWDVTVAALAGDVVGFMAIKPREAVLDQLFIRPGSLGAGLGRALPRHVMQAMPCGFTLYTRSANARARRFYERAGLSVLREGLHPRNRDPVTYCAWTPAATG